MLRRVSSLCCQRHLVQHNRRGHSGPSTGRPRNATFTQRRMYVCTYRQAATATATQRARNAGGVFGGGLLYCPASLQEDLFLSGIREGRETSAGHSRRAFFIVRVSTVCPFSAGFRAKCRRRHGRPWNPWNPRSRIRRASSVARGAAPVIDLRPASFQATGPASATRRDSDK